MYSSGCIIIAEWHYTFNPNQLLHIVTDVSVYLILEGLGVTKSFAPTAPAL